MYSFENQVYCVLAILAPHSLNPLHSMTVVNVQDLLLIPEKPGSAALDVREMVVGEICIPVFAGTFQCCS